MKRFVLIRAEDAVFMDDDGVPVPGFAFFDTIHDSFDMVGGNQAWSGWTDFRRGCIDDGMSEDGIQRYFDLVPPELVHG